MVIEVCPIAERCPIKNSGETCRSDEIDNRICGSLRALDILENSGPELADYDNDNPIWGYLKFKFIVPTLDIPLTVKHPSKEITRLALNQRSDMCEQLVDMELPIRNPWEVNVKMNKQFKISNHDLVLSLISQGKMEAANWFSQETQINHNLPYFMSQVKRKFYSFEVDNDNINSEIHYYKNPINSHSFYLGQFAKLVGDRKRELPEA